ncbi:hypothetical protein [Leptolyngbya sp. FACHB-16]|nr:hypothetical protein [Leptolyngbya sp. FACHB-16]MBD2155341.1 hypothetical protein [Leptolyngbya sp. FACHB-16]
MKLHPECWCFARFAGKAPTFWVNSYAETSVSRLECGDKKSDAFISCSLR